MVFDTSTLILSAKIDLLSPWAERFCLLISKAVEKEALAKPEAYDAQLIGKLIGGKKIRVVSGGFDSEFVRHLQKQFRLARGEASALALAKNKQAVLAVDDGPAIKAAKILGVPFVTCLHILIELYHQKLLSRESALEKLNAVERLARYDARWIADAQNQINR